jgi:alpha-amylase
VQRTPGLFTNTNVGAGFGDMNANGIIQAGDILGTPGTNTVEDILYSRNSKFRAQFDVNGDGLGDNRDLFALGAALVSEGATQAALTAYTNLLLKRADVDGSGTANAADVVAMYGHFGPATWLYDMNVDGVVNIADVSTMITQEFRTQPGDFNVDGKVDGADYVLWRDGQGAGTQYTQGDADLDGDVDTADFGVWRAHYGFVRQPLTPGSGSAATAVGVPESTALIQISVVLAIVGLTTKARRSQWKAPTRTPSCPSCLRGSN